MKCRASSCSAVALTTSFAGVAGAQQAPEEGYEPPQEGYEAPPQQGQAPPPQQYAPPPGYAPPPESAPPPPAAMGLGAVGQIVISDDTAGRGLELPSQSFMGQSTKSTHHPAAAGDRRTSWRRTCRSAASCRTRAADRQRQRH